MKKYYGKKVILRMKLVLPDVKAFTKHQQLKYM